MWALPAQVRILPPTTSSNVVSFFFVFHDVLFYFILFYFFIYFLLFLWFGFTSMWFNNLVLEYLNKKGKKKKKLKRKKALGLSHVRILWFSSFEFPNFNSAKWVFLAKLCAKWVFFLCLP